jgi:phthiocerol/phenolphthiocerol synthesis type-I polyketide synthase C
MTESFPDPVVECITLVDVLRWRALNQPDQRAYTFLIDGETEAVRLTYGELDQRACVVGAQLQDLGVTGERVLLLYPPGLEYIAAFFGCLYAGAIAVPTYPPRLNRPDPRLQAIVADAQATVVLTTTHILSNAERRFAHTPGLETLHWLDTDSLADELAGSWHNPGVGSDTLAFLQYTSGSTATPKGVMVSHGNILYNEKMMQQAFGQTEQSTVVSWLPIYHDMGLIGSVFQPLYVGAQCILMSPLDFLQRPFRWLDAISRYKAQTSGGPNFAYDLCAHKITPEQRATLDLSSWEVAFNGAEPVRCHTLEQFATTFEPCGFRHVAFHPCYGLAEATLFVSGGSKLATPVSCVIEGKALEQDRVVETSAENEEAQTLVGCGRAWLEQDIVIADPQSLTRCLPDQVGEIWVSGSSITRGYWNRQEETERTFQAYLADTGEGPFLRTGDLGFLRKGELFITGRIKDLIIIRGRNHYPQDIELTVEQSHSALQPGSGAAFSVDVDDEERLVIVQEVKRSHRNANMEEVTRAVRQAVAEGHDLQVYAVVLLKPMSIPKTSSGKIQRHLCRTGFLAGDLRGVGTWIQNLKDVEPGSFSDGERTGSPEQSRRGEAIQAWLISHLSRRLGVKPEDIDVQAPFASYGLSSAQAVSLSGELEEWLGYKLSPTLVYNYPSVAALAQHLANKVKTSETTAHIPAGRGTKVNAVAVVGIGCRFPGAQGAEAFWQLLRDGRDAITKVPTDRWDVQALYDPDPMVPGKMTTRWGGFLEQVDQFDPHFFHLSPREAARMDPQQRLLLEVVWEALENAGQTPSRLRGTQTGVFIGISSSDYSSFQLDNPRLIDAYAGTGNAHSIAANRLSYWLDFHGPSLAVDTACSSSLVAVHLACQSLRQGECSLVVAGGVNLTLTPQLTIMFSKAQLMAADGRCKTFAAGADGYVRGEGCGVVVLKRLADAVAAGDNILAVVRGSAINHDGLSNGLTAPNGLAQQAVIRQALANAGVTPSQISYVEAHGTGTSLGDPIEANALRTILMEGRSPDESCAIGSVKTNIGHLEAAAGIASFIKTVLVLHNREIPPNLHLKELNPHISLENTPLFIPTERCTLSDRAAPRLAGVSSFGFGGTNAHVILEEVPPLPPTTNEVERTVHLLTLSAQSENALQNLARRYRTLITARPNVSLGDVCFTANDGRSHFAHRLAIAADSAPQLQQRLEAFIDGRRPRGVSRGLASEHPSPIAFLFTGQGAQYVGMGRQLYETQPTFRRALEQCDEILRPHLEKPLLSVLYPESESDSPLDQTAYTQPTLFALAYALSELWQSWGIEPDAAIGHSVGEYMAACVAGVFGLEDGLKLVVERARLMQVLPRDGEMVSLMADEDRVAAAIAPHDGQVSIAALNGPAGIVVSGRRAAVQAVAARMRADGVKTSHLAVSHAFHSPLMEPMLDDFECLATGIAYSSPQIELVSNVTGQLASGKTMTWPVYWRRHVREAVKFAAGIETLYERGYRLFIEIGPHPTLSGIAARCVPENDETCVWLPSLRRGKDEWAQMLESLGALYVQGGAVDWRGFDRDYGRHRVVLPTYPFERRRCWFKAPAQKESGRASSRRRESILTSADHPLLGEQLSSPLEAIQFESELDLDQLPFLMAHQIHQVPVLPLAGYAEMAVAAVEQTSDRAGSTATKKNLCYELTDLIIAYPLDLTASRVVQLTLSPADDKETHFEVFSRSREDKAPWVLHASGRIHDEATVDFAPTSLAKVQQRCQEEVPGDVLYQQFDGSVLTCGPEFQGIETLWRGNGEALGRIRLPASLLAGANRYHLHPTLLTACFQVLMSTLPGDKDGVAKTCVPVGFARFQFHDGAGDPAWSHAILQQSDEKTFSGEFRLYDETGGVVAHVSGLRFETVDRSALLPAVSGQPSDWLYRPEWRLEPYSSAGQSEEKQQLAEAGSWLVFADSHGVGNALAELLVEQGEICVTVLPGESFKVLNEQQYKIDPENGKDYQQLLDEIRKAFPKRHCRGVVHLWSLDTVLDDATATVDILQRTQVMSCGSALLLVQALADAERSHPPRVWFGTRGAQPAGPDVAPVQMAQAPLWGLGRVIALELPEMWGGLIDFDIGTSAGEAAILLQEIRRPDKEDQVAFRDGKRYVYRLAPDNVPQGRTLPWHAEATYLITGGLGGLGLTVARWMVEQGARHLVLTSRTGLPEQTCWENIPHDSETWQRIQAVRALEEMGAEVKVIQTDAADWDQMSMLFEALQSGPLSLRGVIHAAGISAPQTLLEITPEELEAMLRPKAIGGWVLHQLTRNVSLDFFVSFSSLSSVLGSAHLGHYAAANHFLDALAHHRQALGLPGLSVNWGPWAAIGMTSAEDREVLARIGVEAWTSEEGVDALAHLLQRDIPQVVAAKVDWLKFIPVYTAKLYRPFLEQVEAQSWIESTPPPTQTALVKQLKGTPPGDHRKVLTAYLQDEVAGVLGFETGYRPDPRQGFFEMGMDSLMAVELKRRVEANVRRSLPRTVAFEFPTIETLVDYLLRNVLSLDVSSTAFGETNTVKGERDKRTPSLAEIERLSADGVEALLLRELEALDY